MIFRQDGAPAVAGGQGDEIVFREIDGIGDDSKIQQAFVEITGDVGGVAAFEMVVDAGMLAVQLNEHIGETLHRFAFGAANENVAAQVICERLKFFGGLVDHLQNVFSAGFAAAGLPASAQCESCDG